MSQKIRHKSTIVHWQNSVDEEAKKHENNLRQISQQSSDLANHASIIHDNLFYQNHTNQDFLSSIHRYQRSSILVGKRSVHFFEESGKKEHTFVKFIIEVYNKWGFWITRFAWPAMIICIIFSLLATIKIAITPQRNDLEGYAPFEARSRIEHSKYLNFFSGHGLAISTRIFIVAKDGNSMLRPKHLDDTIQLSLKIITVIYRNQHCFIVFGYGTFKVLNLTLNNIALYNRITHSNQSFNQFCKAFCHLNEPLLQFYNAYLVQKQNVNRDNRANPYLRLNYPSSTLFGREVNVQPYFFGVELYKGNETKKEIAKETEGVRQLFENDTIVESLIIRNKTHPAVMNMKSVKMISLYFNVLQNSQWTNDEMKQWEMDVVHFFKKFKSKHLTIYVVSKTYIEEEMVRAGTSLLPYLIAGFIIMCSCSIITVMIRAAYMHQNNIYKIFLAVMACVTPMLACSTALAILFLLGMRFSSVLCVIPFLVLSIGIDSSYLMIHEWQRVTKEIRDGEKRGETVGHRMSEVLSEVGPAILISAMTNILADAVGCFTSSPEIRLLCIGNLFAMFMTYLYQMSFYSGLMSVVGKFEIAAEKNDDNITNIAIQKDRVDIRKSSDIIRKNSKFHDKSKVYISRYSRVYVNIISYPAIAILIIILYIIYITLSIWGITRMSISLTPEKLFPMDSPLIKLNNLRLKYEIPVFTMVSVFVETPGDLSQNMRLTLLNNMVQDFENTNGSWGPVGTLYFMRDFVAYQNYLQADDDYDYDSLIKGTITTNPDDFKFNADNLPNFLTWPEYDFWSVFIQLENVTNDKNNGTKERLKRFFFTTAYHNEKLMEWTTRAKLLKQWRAIVDKDIYERFHASVFHEDAIFLDLIDNMATDTWQSVAGTLVCMAAVCFLFLRNTFTVIIATASVLSIAVGILGTLSWLNVQLDPISMAAMIISIGFSVDIPAHVAYHYCKASEELTPQMRLGNCLTSVGFPALQAALSTILCVCSLWFAGIYMSQIFVKTMATCVILCNLHGLMILPAILSIIHWTGAQFFENKIYTKPDERVINKRLKKIRKGIAKTKIKGNNRNQLDLKMDRPPIPDFNNVT
uniref:SSD domain-containing protein n=1 Tax=Onchocerca volvulus TaxID=6282 RepID=A0A8R1XS30_ONCVO